MINHIKLPFSIFPLVPLGFRKLLVLVAIVAAIMSVTLFYTSFSLKYILFIFLVSLVPVLVPSSFMIQFNLKIDRSRLCNLIDYGLVTSATTLLILKLFSAQSPEITLILSEVVVFLLPGWCLLRELRIINKLDSILLSLVVSFLVSLGLSSLFFSVILMIKLPGESILIPVIYLSISISTLFFRRPIRSPDGQLDKKQYSILNSSNILPLGWIILFFIFTIASLYPRMAELPDSDIIRHLSFSRELLLSPQLYNSYYAWFHFPLAMNISLSSAQDWLFHVGTAPLSIILIFSFYLMSKKYLNDIDERLTPLATVFFFVFSGFGWLFFIQHYAKDNLSNLLSLTNGVSYWDIGYGESPWLWLWFRPITIGFSILFTVIYLLRRDDLPRPLFIFILSFLVLVLGQIHIPELVVLTFFVFVVSLFTSSRTLRLKDGSISLLIGLTASFLVTNCMPIIIGSDYQTSPNTIFFILFIVAAATIIIANLREKMKSPKVSRKFRFPPINPYFACSIGIFIFMIFLLSWFYSVDSSTLGKNIRILAVPWEFYPVLLGILGLMAIPGITIVLGRYRKHPITIFVLLFFLCICLGRIVTYVNVSIEGTDYWERRMVPFVFASVSILAPVFVISVLNSMKLKHKKLRDFANEIAKVLIISIIVLVGAFSTILSMEFHTLAITKTALSGQEHKLQNSLAYVDPTFTVLTSNERASSIVGVHNPGYLIGYYKFQIWPSVSPELPLKILSILNNKSAIYLNVGDMNKLSKSDYQSGYLVNHLLGLAARPTNLSEGLLILPRLSPPLPSSDTTLVIPNTFSPSLYFAYDTLSSKGINYTTASILDIESLMKSRILIAPNEKIAMDILDYKEKYNLNFKELIILNFDGYGRFGDLNGMGSNFKGLEGDHNQWDSQGINSGNISIPILHNSHGVSNSSNNLNFTIGRGLYSIWQLSLNLDPVLNVSSDDFFTFKWYGKQDYKWYVIEFLTSSGGTIWHRFQDSWNGWKQVIIPLSEGNGTRMIAGVPIHKVASKEARWDSIHRINIRTESSNTNKAGNFQIEGLGFANNLKSKGLREVTSGHKILFPAPVEIYPVHFNKTWNVKSMYDNTTIPFIMDINRDSYNISYVNAVPIMKTMEGGSSVRQMFYPLLHSLLFFNFTHPFEPKNTNIRSLVSGSITAFRSASLVGDIMISADTAILFPNSTKVRYNVDGKPGNVTNISQILPINSSSVIIETNKALTGSGAGFYLPLTLNRSLVTFSGNPAHVLILQNGTNHTYSVLGNKIIFEMAQSTAIIRQPNISLKGNATIDDLYAYGDLSRKIRSLGGDAIIHGMMTFAVQTSDEFTVVGNTSITGEIIRNPSIYSYNDLNNLLQLINFSSMRHIIAVSVILVIINMYLLGKRPSSQRRST